MIHVGLAPVRVDHRDEALQRCKDMMELLMRHKQEWRFLPPVSDWTIEITTIAKSNMGQAERANAMMNDYRALGLRVI